MKRLIVVGSPRTEGRSSCLADLLFETHIQEYPEDELFLIPLSEADIAPCIGCGGCKKTSTVLLKDDKGKECKTEKHRCVYDDDMQALYDLFDEVDEVSIVAPVYFSGSPAPLKCLLDRLQPYFWAEAYKNKKRVAELHVVGEGGDPHGHDALISEVRSALGCAGFRLERVFDWVGKITEQGEITADAHLTKIGK